MLLEVCVDTVESARNAYDGGADRLELCGNLIIGGTTPSIVLFEEVKKVFKGKIHVLIRPRFGDFCYTEAEFEIIKKEIRLFKNQGADGVVIGILNPNGTLDIERMTILMQETKGMSVTLHRAFDMCKDPLQTLEDAVSLSIDTILTSGQRNQCVDGTKLLKELVIKANRRIHILAAGGVGPNMIGEMYETTGITMYHMSGKTVIESPMTYRKKEVSMGLPTFSEYALWQTDFEQIKEAVQVQKSFLLGSERTSILKTIDALEADEKRILQFLYENMPVSDMVDYEFEIYLDYARHGLFLYKNSPFCKNLDFNFFLHYVLFPRINEEDIVSCRSFFYEKIKEHIPNLFEMDICQAALAINYWCAGEATYQSSDDRTVNPMTVYRSSIGRCGEQSTFAVSALRSIGIPARQVYAPRWSHCDDNHAWVEVFCEGTWCFFGACEPEPVLNKGWFTSAASRAMLLHSRTFGECPQEEYKIAQHGVVYESNELHRYGKTTELTVIVHAQEEKQQNITLYYQLLNYAELYPIAIKRGRTGESLTITLGLGSIFLYAVGVDGTCEQVVDTREITQVSLILTKDEKENVWSDFDMLSPVDGSLYKHQIEACVKREAKDKFARCVAHRLEKKEGNTDEINAFFNAQLGTSIQEWKKQLFDVLTVKDQRDCKGHVLIEHLTEAMAYVSDYESTIFVNYILNPRIYFEPMTPYRKFFKEYYSEKQKQDYRNNPIIIWEEICKPLEAVLECEYGALVTSPVGCIKQGRGNLLSKKILFVALCRSFGIPARLNPIDLTMEYYKTDCFVSVEIDPQSIGTCKINLGKKQDWIYMQNITIAKWENQQYKTLNLGSYFESASFESAPVSNVEMEQREIAIKLPVGTYRVITANRLPNGNLFASKCVFKINPQVETKVVLSFRQGKLSDMLNHIVLPQFYLQEEGGRKFLAEEELPKGNQLFLWLEESKEPTEHILNELYERSEEFNEQQIMIYFVLKNKEALLDPTIQRTLVKLRNVTIVYDDSNENMELLGRGMYVDPEKYPLMIGAKDFVGVYGASGYNVGTADMLLRIFTMIRDCKH